VSRDDNAGQDLRWWALGNPDPAAASLKGREGWSKQIAYNVSEGQYEAFRDDIKNLDFIQPVYTAPRICTMILDMPSSLDPEIVLMTDNGLLLALINILNILNIKS